MIFLMIGNILLQANTPDEIIDPFFQSRTAILRSHSPVEPLGSNVLAVDSCCQAVSIGGLGPFSITVVSIDGIQ